ncbi:MAG: radical SAM protein [Endomicrobiales bacterium]|nr:radical SAM protein [Endomicrobiales bacterium]
MELNEFVRPFPKIFRIEPSAACNLRCRHCPTSTIKDYKGMMDDSVFDKVLECIKENIEHIKVVVLYHGGEPLLHPRLCSMVLKMKEYGVPFVKTVTNGMLLTPVLSAALIKSGLDAIEISIDGESPEENNFIRRNSEYEKIVANVNELVKQRIELKSILPEIFIAITLIMNTNDKNTNQDARANVPEFIKNSFKGYAEHIKYKTTFAVNWLNMGLDKEVFSVLPPFSNYINHCCDHVDNTTTIRWNGDIVPCCYDLKSEIILGNIMKSSFKDVWNCKAYLKLRKSIKDNNLPAICENCSVLHSPRYMVYKDKDKLFKKD